MKWVWKKRKALHILYVLYVISGNQSSVVMMLAFGFIASAFLHVPLKHLVLAIVLCRMVAQTCDTGCRDRGKKRWGELMYLKCFIAHVWVKPLVIPGERKEDLPRGTGGTARWFAVLQFFWPPGGQEVRTITLVFSSLLSSSVFLCKILDKAWVTAMWEKSYWKYSVCRSQMAPWINAPACYWGGSGANPVWSGNNLAISLLVGIEVYVDGRIQLCAKPLLGISKDL